MVAFIFPGQGSQVVGMGREVFDKYPDLIHKADDILGYSIKTLCLKDPLAQLSHTQFTQPALFVVNALMYFDKIKDMSQTPDYVCGHSLGEYNALLAAQAFDFETGLKLVKKRGELMSQAKNGAMAALIGLSAEAIQAVLVQHHLNQVSVANYNSHTQIVISGMQEEVMRALPLLETAGATMVIHLKVSGAFHSPLMRPAQTEFSHFIKQFHFSSPKIPVVSNVTANFYETHEIQKNLVSQIASPVRWTESIELLLSRGEQEFVEVGPGKVLTGLVRRIKSGS